MVKKLQITSVTKNTVRVFALAGSFVKTRFDLGAKMVLAIVCVFGFNFTALSQNGGMPANFEIDGGVYSGTIGAGIDDWFQGSSGFGLIDTSDAAAYLNITQGNLNQPFVVGSNFNQYEVINGSLLYEAIFIRDYVNLNSIGGGLDRTTFGGGQKNADNPVTAWSFNSSSVGEKNDIVDSYIHLRRGGNSIDSSLWIDLGVSCMSSSGNHFIDFELFKSQIEVAGNGFVNSGPDQGHTSWVFDAAGNVISTGDIVIGFSYTSETVNEVLARIWVKRTDFSNINPVNFDWGVNFDGDWNGYGYAEVVIPDGLTIFEDLSGASTPAPPWGTFNDNTNSPFSTVYTSGNLAELGVDLTALGVDPRLAKGGDACESPWTKVIVKSRTSTSFTSQLKDFSGPYDFLEPPVFDTSIKDPGIFNCKASLELSPENPNDSAYFTWTTTDGEFIDGTMSASGAIVEIVKPGFYTLSASPFPGCEATSTTIYVDGGPCAEDDTRTVFFDLPLNIDVVANDDYGNNGPSLTEPIIITQNPSNGVVEINDNNTPDDLSDDTIIYTPNPGYTGFDQFNYKIIDANGHESETTVYLSVSDVFIVPPGERGCDCAPFYENSNFANPTLIGGAALSEGAKYRFPNIFPNNVHGTSIDAIVEIVAFINGATLLDIDVANEGLPRAFQPKINSTNNGDQSVKFDISFVASGTMTPVDISFFGSPFDIDGDSRVTREYAELSLPDSYYTSGNTLIEIIDTGESIRGTAINPITAPGGAISQDPRFTFSNYWEGKNKLSYTIGKQNGNFDRFYALVLDNAEYVNPESTILSAPVICGNVSDEGGDPLTNVEVDIIGSDGSTGTVATDINGDYRYATSIPSAMVDVTYVVIENDNSGYVSISDVDGANDNRITRVINLMSTCGNDFVDDGRPDAVDDSTSVLPLETVTIDVLLNDTFGPDLAATGAIIITTQPSQGTAVVNTNGTPNDPTDDFIEFTAPLIDATDLQFAYQICDSDNDCDVATVTVTVNPLIDTIAVDDIENTFINTTVVGNVLTNDFDAQGDIQSVSSLVVTTVQGITVNIDASGSYSYTPPADFIGEDSFMYTVCDNGNPQACDTATVFIEVLPIPTSKNDPPVANADTGVTEINTPVEGSVLSNDFDPDGDPITVTANTDPSNGVLVMNPDGTYEYTPNTDFVGEDTFTYTICDNGNPAACDTATVTIQVIPDFANITVANDDAYLGTIDTDILGNVLDNDTDPEGDAQTASLATDPSNGSVVLNADGTFTYTPDSGYTGPDEFTYTVTDAQGAKDTATVSLVIAPVSNTTTAIDDINNTYVNTAVTGNVLTNDDDAEGDIQTVSSNTDPSNGVLVMNTDGTYEYTPNTDFVGEDTFTYTVCDDGNPQACDTAIVYLEVLPEPTSKNDPPVANADTGVTEINTPVEGSVLSNDFDPDGDPITVTANTDPSNGVLVMNPDGTYEYTPNTDFVGEDTFTYTICDNGSPAACDTATVTIQVIPDTANITVANDDAYLGTIDTDILGNVLDNDTDPEGDAQTASLATAPSNGSVVLNADGTFTYTPDSGYTGPDEFTYTVTDAQGATDTATVSLVIAPVSNTTTAIDDINDTFVNTTVTGNVLTNDDDAEGDIQTVSSNTDPSNGVLVMNPDGTYEYTPNTDFVGEDTFTYTVCDDGNPQACDTAIVYLEVLPEPTSKNDPPVANADTGVTEINTPVEGSVLSNDFDPDGDPITVTANTDPSNGVLVMNPDGTYEYTPNTDFVGEDTFTYTICDNGSPAACDTATVTIQVIPDTANITVANDDAYLGTIDTDILGNVLDNDTDPEGDAQTASLATAPSNGSVILNADGTFTYTPDSGYTGPDEFTYTVTDAQGATDTATVSLVIAPVSNTTTAIDDINDTFVNTAVTGNVLTNDDDAEGDIQTVSSNTDPSNGVLVMNPDGTYEYTPNTDFVGEDTFTYTVCDDGNPQACDTAIVYLEVLPEPTSKNDPPVANADTGVTEINTPVEGSVLSNDFDPDGDPITVTANTDPSNGVLVMNPDGTYEYTPNTDFVGEDTFTYTICDNGSPAACDTATVTIQVIPDTANITVANDDAYLGTIDTDILGNVLDNDTDPEGDAQTASLATAPSNGSVVLNADGTFTYTPDSGYTGPDEFTYTVTDAQGATDTATVSLVIAPVSNTTTAIDDINDTFVNTAVTGNVLTNDDDAEGDIQTVSSNTDPSNGVLVMNPDGTYEYTPNTDFVGEDTFTYTVCDDGNPQACDTAIVYLEVLPEPTSKNDPPVANADTGVTEINTPVEGSVLSNDFDPDGDPITVTANTDPSNGVLVMNPDGTYEYTPNTDFVGEDTFTYTICDNGSPAACDTATVTIQVIPDTANITVANDDAYLGTIDTDILGNVLDNDTDPEGDAQTASLATAPSNGSVVLNADGTFTYTPDSGYTGPDEFTYTVTDAQGATDTATVSLVIAPVSNTTTAIDDINDTFVNTAVTGNVLTNDDDAEGDIQTVSSNTDPSNGVLVMNPDGTYEYTPNTDFVGEDTFTYTVCDDGNPQACDTAIVYLEVLPEPTSKNDPPVANADTGVTEINTPVEGSVLSNDFDPDGDPITVTANTDPSNGVLVMNPDGTYEYTPNTDFVGEDTFTYTICDNGSPAACDTATVTIQVIPDTANITVANDDAYLGTIDTDILGNVLDNDTDPEGDAQTASLATAPSNGSVILNADGTFTYTPDSGYTGPDEFTYTVTDAQGATDTATVSLVIAPVSNTTTAIDDINNTFVNTAVTGNVLTNDDDAEGDTQTVSSNTDPSNGVLVMNPDGTYQYTPNTDFVGEDTFTYTVCDDGNPQACDTANVYLEVLPISGPNNEAPVANADSGITEVNTPLTGNVLPNDFDPDGDPLIVTGNTNPSNGLVLLLPNGSFIYTPNADFVGEDTFTYTICDNSSPAACDTATVTIQVIPDVANITVANDDAYNGISNADILGNVLDNDTDPEGDAQTTLLISDPANGTVVLNDDGTFTYTSNLDYVGPDSFVYQVTDTQGATDTATVYLTVGMQLIPDYGPTLFTGVTTIVGNTGVIDFRVLVAEFAGQNSNGVTPVELRIVKSDDLLITFDPASVLVNGFPVSNTDWLFDNSSPTLYKFIYIGNNGIFPANSASMIGLNAVYLPLISTEGEFPLQVTVKFNSGGETNNSNNNDVDFIEFDNDILDDND